MSIFFHLGLIISLSLLTVSLCLPSRHSILSATVPRVTPQYASPRIDPNFIGFAFEEASFYLYATDEYGGPNQFSLALMQDILGRSGGTPILRVGGTSGDKGYYNASQQEPAMPDGRFSPPQWTEPWLSIGPSFFKAYTCLPGCRFVVMLPMSQDNITNTLEWAEQVFATVPLNAIEAIEIGNEPNLYTDFTPEAYAKQWLEFQSQLIAKFPWLADKLLFQVLDYSNDPANSSTVTSISEAMNAGLNTTGQLKQISYHYYEQADMTLQTLADLQYSIVNHTRVVSHLATYTEDIAFLQRAAPDTPFVLGEDGNSIPNSASIGPDQRFSNILGTALWNVDWQLQAMSIGVTRVNMQQVFYPGYAMWQSQSNGLLPAGVLANFYSQPLVGDFIGLCEDTRVAELHFNSLDDPALFSGYAAYDLGRLSRIVLVNLQLWDAMEFHTERPLSMAILDGLEEGCFRAHWLEAPDGAYANTSITYDGMIWEYPSGSATQVRNDGGVFCVSEGSLSIAVESTSAVLLSWIETAEESL